MTEKLQWAWPCLTPEEMKRTLINFADARVVDTRYLDDKGTLYMMREAFALDAPNDKALKKAIVRLGEGHWPPFHRQYPPPPNSPNIILIHKDDTETLTWHVQGGYVTILEIRNKEGNLTRRDFYHRNNMKYYLHETWAPTGRLKTRIYYDDRGDLIGPCYDHKGPIKYYMYGYRVDKKTWDAHILQLVMDATPLPKELCSLTTEYVF